MKLRGAFGSAWSEPRAIRACAAPIHRASRKPAIIANKKAIGTIIRYPFSNPRPKRPQTRVITAIGPLPRDEEEAMVARGMRKATGRSLEGKS
jgi:hypothetical protein